LSLSATSENSGVVSVASVVGVVMVTRMHPLRLLVYRVDVAAPAVYRVDAGRVVVMVVLLSADGLPAALAGTGGGEAERLDLRAVLLLHRLRRHAEAGGDLTPRVAAALG
jgi:hypothetical protein